MIMLYLLESSNFSNSPVHAHLCGLLEEEPKALQKTKSKVQEFLHSAVQG